MSTPHETALAEYARRRDSVTIAIGQRRISREQADRVLRAWLAMVILAGGDHPDAASALDRYAAPELGFTPAQQRVLAASWASPNGEWRTELQRVTAQAVDSAACERSTAHARALLALARCLGHTGPFTGLPKPQRKAA